VDGPNEWNGGWAAAKKCVVCRKKIKDIDTDFTAFQKAMYRPWAHEFAGSGYNLAMPVVYARHRTFDSYSFANRDYRWFYNMLLEASSVGRSASAGLAVMPFVFGGLDRRGGKSAPNFAPLSVAKYEELL